MGKKEILFFVAVSSLITISFGLFAGDNNFKSNAMLSTGLYFISVSFIIWLAVILRNCRFTKEYALSWLKNNYLGLALSLIVVIIFFISAPPRFRIFLDEPHLVAVSKTMMYHRSIDVDTQGYWYHNKYLPINSADTVVTPKRPLLFPFLMYIAHIVRGYSAYNGFLVNFIASFLFLFNVYLLGRHFLDERFALAGVMFTASYPVISLFSTSSGFEILNVFFLVLSLRYFYEYLKEQEPHRLNKLLLTLVLLTQCRYESAGIAAILILAVFYLEFRQKFKNVGPMVAIIPILYLPVFWQRLSTWDIEIKTVMAVKKHPAAVFSIEYLVKYLPGFFQFLFSPGLIKTSAFLISYLALFGSAYLCFVLFSKRDKISAENRLFLAVCGLIFLFNLILINSCAFGAINSYAGCRFVIIFIPFIAFLAVIFLRYIVDKLNLRWFLAPIIFGIFIFSHQIAVINIWGNSYTYYHEYAQDMAFLKNFPREKQILIVAHYPDVFVIHNLGAVNFEYANYEKNTILNKLGRGILGSMVVLQEIEFATGKPTKETTLDPAYKLTTIKEVELTDRIFRRYSVCAG